MLTELIGGKKVSVFIDECGKFVATQKRSTDITRIESIRFDSYGIWVVGKTDSIGKPIEVKIE